MSWQRLYGVRGLAASVAGSTLRAPRPPQPSVGHRQEHTVRLPGLAGASLSVIHERVRCLIAIFAIDDSGSTQGLRGTDPQGARYAACQSVLDLMRRHGGGRAGIVHWGDRAPVELALSPVPVHRGRRQLNHALGLRPQLGGTNPAIALTRVRELVPTIRAEETLAVLMLTDGQDLGVSLTQELSRLPHGSVHLVLVDPSGDCYGREAAWRALPWGSFTRLKDFDRERVAWESGAVLARAIGLELPALPGRQGKEEVT